MIPSGPATRVFVALEPVDMRKGYDGLYGLVTHQLGEDPRSGHRFVFTNSQRNRLKILYWDGTGSGIGSGNDFQLLRFSSERLYPCPDFPRKFAA